MKNFSGFQGKTNGEARRLPFFLAASFGTGMVYTDEAGVKAFLNGASGIIAWDPGSSGKDEGNALTLLVACSEIQFFRENPAYENPLVYLNGSEDNKDDLPEWIDKIKPGFYGAQDDNGEVWEYIDVPIFDECYWKVPNQSPRRIGKYPLRSDYSTTCWYANRDSSARKIVIQS